MGAQESLRFPLAVQATLHESEENSVESPSIAVDYIQTANNSPNIFCSTFSRKEETS